MRVANAARIRQRCLLHFFPFAESFVGRSAKCRAQGVIYVSTTHRHRVFPMHIENSIFCPKNMGLCDLVAGRTDANCRANRRILAHLSIESVHRRPQSRNIAIEAAVLFADRIREPFLRRGQRPRRSIRCWPGAQGAEIRRSHCLRIDLHGKWNYFEIVR
jgi:hypothetical protein